MENPMDVAAKAGAVQNVTININRRNMLFPPKLEFKNDSKLDIVISRFPIASLIGLESVKGLPHGMLHAVRIAKIPRLLLTGRSCKPEKQSNNRI